MSGIERSLDLPGTKGLSTLLAGGVALIGAGSMAVDQGTRLSSLRDVRQVLAGTKLNDLQVQAGGQPFVVPTRMDQLNALAPLSFRDWGTVFGVSHTTIGLWADKDPGHEKLDRVLDALREASFFHTDLASWLRAPIPGMSVRPLDLLRNDRWRAFRGAIRTRTAPAVTLSADELRNRREAEVSWVTPEPLTVTDDE
ncbi:MAG: hypothetical protein H0V26_11045 [Solirubrobacterales bacterium]|nr:hypothetical protein [Solirubrobacterales bacterium]